MELVQVLVIRRDLWLSLGWPIGAIVAQGAHASVAVLNKYQEHGGVKEYLSNLNSMTKVVKEVS